MKAAVAVRFDEIEIDKIRVASNTRTHFNRARLNELAHSITENGIIEPLVVTVHDNSYILICGERRYRAAQIAGLECVPCFIRDDVSIDEIKIMQLAENTARNDLSPIELALALSEVLEAGGMTQEQLARQIGCDRTRLTKAVKTAQLPEDCRQYFHEQDEEADRDTDHDAVEDDAATLSPRKPKPLSLSHGEVLCKLLTEGGRYDAEICKLAKKACEKGLSCAQLHALVRKILEGEVEKGGEDEPKSSELHAVGERISQFLDGVGGAKVAVKRNASGLVLSVTVGGIDDLQAVVGLICKTESDDDIECAM
ncbi:MAG: ParB/RepB/Spo0J family partition protein [Defluviitaleaceae bacterium]|nr:ParB/RepB/Spo0J family partition protein [Defluviitaleaceae bacterium]